MILERGITALSIGFDIFNFKENDEILIPNKVCEDILQLLKLKNIKPLFYPLDVNLSPNWAYLNDIISRANNIKGILMIHFFGQPQDINLFIEYRNNNNIILIEDNAHGHGGYYNGTLLGKFGDFGISSPRKLLDLNTVGIFYLNNNYNYNLPKIFKRAEISYISSYARKLQFYFPKLRSFLLLLKNYIINSDENNSIELNIKLADKYSEKIYLNTNWEDIAYKRRCNWNLWANYMKKFGFNPIFKLNNSSSPWAIPFYINSEDEFNKWCDWAKKKGNLFFLWPNIKFSNNTPQIMCIRLDIKPLF